jgi:tripartite-type tricarboxylate transporter receptor subunit TctC
MRGKLHWIFKGVLLATAFLLLAPPTCGLGTALAGSYPEKPIELIIPFPAGGRTDLNARMWASVANQYLGVPVACINKTGGRGAPAAQYVLDAKPDGYTIFAATIGTNILWPPQGIGKYKVFDFTTIGRISTSTMVIATSPKKPWKNIQELIDDAKKRPRKITYGAVKGAMSQLAFLIFAKEAGVQFRHVATEGDAPALSSALGGHIDLYISTTTSTVAPHAKAGNLRPLAVFSDKRHPSLPDTPTFKEMGINVVAGPWTGIAARNDIPNDVLMTLRKAFDDVLTKDKAFPKLMKKIGEQVDYMSGADFEKQWKEQAGVYAQIIKELGLGKK